jgi:hypothetical protein
VVIEREQETGDVRENGQSEQPHAITNEDHQHERLVDPWCRGNQGKGKECAGRRVAVAEHGQQQQRTPRQHHVRADMWRGSHRLEPAGGPLRVDGEGGQREHGGNRDSNAGLIPSPLPRDDCSTDIRLHRDQPTQPREHDSGGQQRRPLAKLESIEVRARRNQIEPAPLVCFGGGQRQSEAPNAREYPARNRHLEPCQGGHEDHRGERVIQGEWVRGRNDRVRVCASHQSPRTNPELYEVADLLRMPDLEGVHEYAREDRDQQGDENTHHPKTMHPRSSSRYRELGVG